MTIFNLLLLLLSSLYLLRCLSVLNGAAICSGGFVFMLIYGVVKPPYGLTVLCLCSPLSYPLVLSISNI